jgi:hypothetical protein
LGLRIGGSEKRAERREQGRLNCSSLNADWRLRKDPGINRMELCACFSKPEKKKRILLVWRMDQWKMGRGGWFHDQASFFAKYEPDPY